MFHRQSPNAGPSRHALDRALAIFDRAALGMLYLFVIAGLPLAAFGVMSGVV